MSITSVYDFVGSCQLIFGKGSPVDAGAAVSLDTAAASPTIEIRTNRRTFFSEIRSILEKPSCMAKRPKLAR